MFDGERCIRCRNWHKFEDLTALPTGWSLCPSCAQKLDETKQRKYLCPADGREMKQDIIEGFVVVNKCSECGSMFFDGRELETLKENLKQQQEAAQSAMVLMSFLGSI